MNTVSHIPSPKNSVLYALKMSAVQLQEVPRGVHRILSFAFCVLQELCALCHCDVNMVPGTLQPSVSPQHFITSSRLFGAAASGCYIVCNYVCHFTICADSLFAPNVVQATGLIPSGVMHGPAEPLEQGPGAVTSRARLINKFLKMTLCYSCVFGQKPLNWPEFL